LTVEGSGNWSGTTVWRGSNLTADVGAADGVVPAAAVGADGAADAAPVDGDVAPSVEPPGVAVGLAAAVTGFGEVVGPGADAAAGAVVGRLDAAAMSDPVAAGAVPRVAR
jgi:hypothetical protein